MLLIYAVSIFSLSNVAQKDLIVRASSLPSDNANLNLKLGDFDPISLTFNPKYQGDFYLDLTMPQSKFYQAKLERIAEEKAEIAKQEALAQQNLSKEPDSSSVALSYQGDFTTLYQQAGMMFNVPWQLLAAVHITESGQANTPGPVSYAGAVGPMQFMPSTFKAYAVDANGNGASVYEVEDAVYTAAKYLALGGADKGDYQTALYNYNHSNTYVAHVLAIASSLGL